MPTWLLSVCNNSSYNTGCPEILDPILEIKEENISARNIASDTLRNIQQSRTQCIHTRVAKSEAVNLSIRCNKNNGLRIRA